MTEIKSKENNDKDFYKNQLMEKIKVTNSLIEYYEMSVTHYKIHLEFLDNQLEKLEEI